MLANLFLGKWIALAKQHHRDRLDAFRAQSRQRLQRSADAAEPGGRDQHARPIESTNERQLQLHVVERRKRGAKGFDNNPALSV